MPFSEAVCNLTSSATLFPVASSEGTAVSELTVERAKELLNYCPETGAFTRRIGGKGASKGATAGCKREEGYRVISVAGKRYYSHRLAWFIAHGAWPIEQIDHINGIRDDNRLVNLREASNSLNSQNLRSPQANNKSGYLGVSFDRKSRLFIASISDPTTGRSKRLGRFATAKEAHAAYLAAKRQMHSGCTI